MRKYVKIVENICHCDDCPNFDFMSVDCEPYGYCRATGFHFDFGNKKSSEVYNVPIPGDCPLDIQETVKENV